jgi:hypothetical protein
MLSNNYIKTLKIKHSFVLSGRYWKLIEKLKEDLTELQKLLDVYSKIKKANEHDKRTSSYKVYHKRLGEWCKARSYLDILEGKFKINNKWQ